MAIQKQEAGVHFISYNNLILVWIALMFLTALTVWVSRQNLGVGHILGALAIAVLKGGLVIAFFMHMSFEGRLLRWLLFVALLTLAVFIGLTFVDLAYR